MVEYFKENNAMNDSDSILFLFVCFCDMEPQKFSQDFVVWFFILYF